MSTNTGLLVGFGLLGLFFLASFETGVTTKATEKTKPAKPKNQPKKIVL